MKGSCLTMNIVKEEGEYCSDMLTQRRKEMMRLGTIFISTALIMVMISAAFSQSAVTESFNYPGGIPLGYTGGEGNGWSTGWAYDTSTAVNVGCVSDAGLVYDDLNYEVPFAGNHLQMNMPGGWQDTKYDRFLSQTWPDEVGKEYWVSLLFQTSQAPTGNTYYITKLFNNGAEICAIGKGGGGTLYTCGSGWPGGSGDDVSTVECVGDPVWLVTQIICSGGGNSRTYMWIDPDPAGGAPDTNSADVKRNSDLQGGFNKIRVECGGEDSLQVHWDEIRLGTSFDDLVSPATALDDEKEMAAVSFELHPNYPNPFNPTTMISYSLKNIQQVRLTVYDITGKEIKVLVDGNQNSGSYKINFNAESLSTGVYFYRLSTPSGNMTRKMLLIK